MPGSASHRREGIRIGVIGCGAVACEHRLPALVKLPGASVVALADPRREARERAAGIAGAEAFASSERVLGRRDLDAVLICTEPAEHPGLAAAVAESGKHLHIEQPIAPSAIEAAAVARIVASSGITAAVGFDGRFDPYYERARELLREGAIGPVRQLRTRFDRPLGPDASPWRRRRAEGGGALADLGAHHLDLAQWLLGERITEIEEAEIASLRSEGDQVALAARTESGVRVEAEFSYRGPPTCLWSIRGERGVLLVDRRARSVRVVPRGERDRGAALRRFQTRLYSLPGRRAEPAYSRSLAAFLGRVAGRGGDLATVEDGVRIAELARRVELAAS